MSDASDIAIVGLACRFPGARSAAEFWRNLEQGVESITRFTDAEMLAAGVAPELIARPDYVKASPVIDGPDRFDAAFFGYAPHEAIALDPQQRVLLELSHAALEDAGCDPMRYRGHAGVYVGCAMNTYLGYGGLGETLAETYIPTLVASDKDFLATRISYQLGLRGPSLAVQTACSTSLVALHLARQSLISEETDLALAGAVSIRAPHRAGYLYDGSGVVSRDGHVRTFDADANGTVFGSGAGVVVLKRLSDALADGDRIHAVIKGSAINNDGADKAGYTAPSVDGQAAAVVEALANAGVSAEELSYVEAHGTGTPVGDPIELRALTKAFREFTPRNGICAIGSVKTNVGHLDAAAGMAGLIKTVLALQHRKLPATLNFTRPNEEIDFPRTPFVVNASLRDWSSEAVRRAGVMATGMGGTNAFVVLEEPPTSSTAHLEAKRPHVLLLSAKTSTALEAASANLAASLDESTSTPDLLARTAHTLQAGRRVFEHRRFVLAETCEQAVAALRDSRAPKHTKGNVSRDGAPPVAFLLPGVGDQYVGMGRGLYENSDIFRTEIDRCAEILRPLIGTDIRQTLYPARSEPTPAPSRGLDFKKMLGRSEAEPASVASATLDRAIDNQPALFAVEYALARLWQHWGVQPARLVGHSMGEYVAACFAGVFSLEDALRLIAVRAKLVNDFPRGAMLAVMASAAELTPLLPAGVSLALINGPKLCVVAGLVAPMEEFQRRLQDRAAIFRPVRNGHAFHSQMLAPIVEPFAQEVARVTLSAPTIPFISNVTGTWITDVQATSPRYWAEHLCTTARFSDALAQLWQLPEHTLLEIGPGRTLGLLAMQHPARGSRVPLSVASLRHSYENQSDLELILQSAGKLWVAGTPLASEQFEPKSAHQKITLPTYPFERQSYWLPPRTAATAAKAGEFKTDLSRWTYVPSWARVSCPTERPENKKQPSPLWLILADEPAFAEQLCGHLIKRDADFVVARFSTAHARKSEDAWEISPASIDDYRQLLTAVSTRAASGLNVIHLGALSPRLRTPATGYDPLREELGFHSAMTLVQAIGELRLSMPIALGLVTAQAHEVTGEEALNPLGAMLAGLSGVIPREHPNIASFTIDLAANNPTSATAEDVLREFDHPVARATIAYRGKFRWARTFRAEKLAPTSAPATPLRPRGVYLITGGTGGIGLTIARHLAQACQARLILTRRSPLPPKEEWTTRLADGSLADSERRIVEAIQEIESIGAVIEVHEADVTDHARLRRLVNATVEKHGSLDGVIHTAGLLREGVIELKSLETSDAVLRPKVQGTLGLFDAIRDVKPDFFVLFSSASSVIGFHGQSDYAAANAFLDAFASYANSHSDFPTVSIGWPAWRDVGILTAAKKSADLESRRVAAQQRAILAKDGVEIFHHLITAPQSPHVIVSPRDLEFVIAEAGAPLAATPSPYASAPADILPANQLHVRAAAVDEPRDEVERAIAAMWTSALNVTPIGVHERFLDLGGHSLMAMRIVSQLRTTYAIDFTLRQFFEHPTIAGNAAAVQAAVLAEIESLPESAESSLSA